MPEHVRAALHRAAERLAATSGTSRLDAELLMAHALGVTRDALLMARLDDPAPAGFAPLVERRLRHEPVAYITGTRGFWTIELGVGPGVLVPRADSETLIEAAIAHFAGTAGPAHILDLGTGSGALLLAALAEWPAASGVGIDRSEEALAIAGANAARLGLAARAELRPGGWGGTGAAHDLVLCNPPYVAAGAALPPEVVLYEPAGALFAGADGLDDHRAIAPLIGRQIAAGGIACVEIGGGQAEAAGALFVAAGLDVRVARDLGGRERCLALTHGRA